MPTYNYCCKDCGNVQEEFHSFKDSPEIKCSECGKDCERLFSPNGSFILKGDGWSANSKLKQTMLKKNAKMKTKMFERTKAGESVSKISDLKR